MSGAQETSPYCISMIKFVITSFDINEHYKTVYDCQHIQFTCRCMCSNCSAMPTLKESKCCQTTNIVDGKIESEGLTCITEHEGFIVNCLNRYVLETSYYDYRLQNGPLEENQLVHE